MELHRQAAEVLPHLLQFLLLLGRLLVDLVLRELAPELMPIASLGQLGVDRLPSGRPGRRGRTSSASAGSSADRATDSASIWNTFSALIFPGGLAVQRWNVDRRNRSACLPVTNFLMTTFSSSVAVLHEQFDGLPLEGLELLLVEECSKATRSTGFFPAVADDSAENSARTSAVLCPEQRHGGTSAKHDSTKPTAPHETNPNLRPGNQQILPQTAYPPSADNSILRGCRNCGIGSG